MTPRPACMCSPRRAGPSPQARASWLRAQLWASYRRFLAAVPAAQLARSPELYPTDWSIGHVAFTFDYLVALPLRLPTAGVLWRPTRRPSRESAAAAQLGAQHGVPLAAMLQQASSAAVGALGEWWSGAHDSAKGGAHDSAKGGAHDSAGMLVDDGCGGEATVCSAHGGAKRGGGDPDRAVLRTQAWTLYDSMRVSGAERWALWEEGELPDARLYLYQVHAMADTLISDCISGVSTRQPGTCNDAHDGAAAEVTKAALLPPCVSYLLLYSIVHTLWHTEDLIHTLNLHKQPPPPPPAQDEAEPAPPPNPPTPPTLTPEPTLPPAPVTAPDAPAEGRTKLGKSLESDAPAEGRTVRDSPQPPSSVPEPPCPPPPTLPPPPTMPPPPLPPTATCEPCQGVDDVCIPGGIFFLGAEPDGPLSDAHPRLILDCEKWVLPLVSRDLP